MSSIDYLYISGLRSFHPRPDPEQRSKQQLKFFSPLTVILGPNGTGKTTIIESIRNACTGDLPPNTRNGHGFIHDPKIIGEADVKGQVKLQFTTAQKRPMVVSRSYQLTQRAKTLTFKTLDVTVQTKSENDELMSSTFKTADIDSLIPDLLGVAKPILDSVMFCHQEDCCWPLSEPGELKKRFDAIFSATRYTKALEEVRKTKKELQGNQRQYETDITVLEEHKKQADKLQSGIEERQVKNNELKAQINNLRLLLEKEDIKRTAAEEACAGVQHLRDSVIKQEAMNNALQETAKMLSNRLLQEFTESDEELHSIHQEFTGMLDKMVQEIAELEQQLHRLSTEQREVDTGLSNQRADLRVFEEQQRVFQRKLTEMQGIVRECSLKYQIGGETFGQVDSQFLSGDSVLKFVREFQQVVSKLQTQCQENREKHRGILEECDKTLNQLRVKHDSMDAETQNNKQMQEKIKAVLKAKKADADEFGSLKVQIRAVEDQLAQLDQQIKAKQAEVATGSTTATAMVDEKRQRIQSLTAEREQLKRDLEKREAEQQLMYRLQSQKAEKEKKEKALHDLIRSSESAYSRLIGRSLDPTLAEGLVRDKHQEKTKALQSEQSKMAGMKERVSHTVHRRAEVQKMIDNLNASCRTLHERLKGAVQESNVSNELKNVQKDLEKLTKKINTTNALRNCYETFINQAQKKNECPVCTRRFCGRELDQFVTDQSAKLSNAPAFIKDTEVKYKQAKERSDRLQELQPLEHELQRLTVEELPRYTAELKQLEESLQDAQFSFEDLKGKVQSLRADEASLGGLVKECAALGALAGEVGVLQSDIRNEELRLARDAKGSKPITELRREYEEIQTTIDEVTHDINNLWGRSEQEQAEIRKMEGAIALKKDELNVLRLKNERRVQIRKEYEGQVEELQRLREQLEHTQLHLPAVKEEIARVSEVKTQKQKEAQQSNAALEATLAKHNQDLAILTTNTRDVQEFLQGNRQEKHSDLKRQVQVTEERYTRLGDRIAACQKTLGDKKRVVESKVTLKADIEANIDFRAHQKAFHDGLRALKDLQAQLHKGQSRLQSDEFGRMDCFELRDSANTRLQKIKVEIASYEGMEKELTNELNMKIVELKSPKYEKINERYTSMMIKLKTTEMTQRDLDKYAFALDTALVKYHSVKMQEINALIRELWQSTYRGQDIDYIELKSDQDGRAVKSYNYRVVMVKGDCSLDMRGRCSAGQKVLASLIIRLALSEAFCEDCGILALDEPTTNLDHANITSLAEALLAILKQRQNRSFQLIVITHDEEFVRKLGMAEFAEFFYQVSKDNEGNFSCIDRRAFSEF